MPITLTTSQRARLKAKAHALEPVVQVGAAGASEKVIAEVDRSLTAHGLIKVRLAVADRETRDELAQTLSERTAAAVVQQVGRILVLWRPRPDDEALLLSSLFLLPFTLCPLPFAFCLLPFSLCLVNSFHLLPGDLQP
jgi:RNA-binding protein